jgi:ribosomal protein S11
MKVVKLKKLRKTNNKILKRKLPISQYWIRKKRTLQYYKTKKKYINFKTRLVLKKRNPNKKRYFVFFRKNKNNIFITVTDFLGRVIIAKSAGYCKIKTKKKKRSPDTVKEVATSVAKSARLKNIKYLFKFYISSKQAKSGRSIYETFKKSGVFILQAVLIRNKPHALGMRKKKPKRL